MVDEKNQGICSVWEPGAGYSLAAANASPITRRKEMRRAQGLVQACKVAPNQLASLCCNSLCRYYQADSNQVYLRLSQQEL